MSDTELAELRKMVETLTAKVDDLTGEVQTLRGRIDPIDEDTMMAIAAAVSAYLGNRARIKQVHFHTGRAWAQAGRSEVQRRKVPHVR
ncbi:hypothetical protein [Enemella sp. A6]|uniref:hypothetical protein n=1 Tax=Enemella sp. A6 TaxID=3440152 RepID=UPI003EC119BF